MPGYALVVDERFETGVGPRWVRLIRGHGDQTWSPGVLRLWLRPGPARPYSLSQLDDYHLDGQVFAWRPPLRLTVRSRFSHAEGMVGTAGFGFWNAPFRGETARAIVASPQVAWFFYASPHNNLAFTHGWDGWGFFAQVVRGPAAPRPLLAAGWALTKLPLLGRLVLKAGTASVAAGEHALQAEMTAWHLYRLEWEADGVRFFVDEEEVYQSPVSPRPPLAFVAWVDNQFLNVRTGMGGYVPVPGEQWLDLAHIHIEVK